MKNLLPIFRTTVFIPLLSLLVWACTNENDNFNESMTKPSQQVKFELSVPAENNPSARTASLSEVTQVIFSIVSSDGEDLYDLDSISVLKLPDDEYVTPAFDIPVGIHELTFFAMADDIGNILYVTPLQGSEMSLFVEESLPIEFSVSDGQVTTLSPPLVSTADGDTGYGQFGYEFNPVEALSVAISVFEQGEEEGFVIPTGASLTVEAITSDDQVDWSLTTDVPAETSVLKIKSSEDIAYYIFHVIRDDQQIVEEFPADALKANPVTTFVFDAEQEGEFMLTSIVAEKYISPGSGYQPLMYSFKYDDANRPKEISYFYEKTDYEARFLLTYNTDNYLSKVKHQQGNINNKTQNLEYKNFNATGLPGLIKVSGDKTAEIYFKGQFSFEYNGDNHLLSSYMTNLDHHNAIYTFSFDEDSPTDMIGYDVARENQPNMFQVTIGYDKDHPNTHHALQLWRMIQNNVGLLFYSTPYNPHLLAGINPAHQLTHFEVERDYNGEILKRVITFNYTYDEMGLPTDCEIVRDLYADGILTNTVIFQKSTVFNYAE